MALTDDHSKATEIFGIHKLLSEKMLKFDIHKGREDHFETFAYQATHITVMVKKTKSIWSLPEYFTGVLRDLICDALFSDIYQEYSVSVDDFYLPGQNVILG